MSSLAVPKHYADRAVQTDLTITFPSGPGFTIDISDTSTYFLPALKTVSPLETESLTDIPGKSSAYTRSEHLPSENAVEILASRKDRKLVSLGSGLGYPSTCVTKTERVVSFPEHSSSSDAARFAMVEKQQRVVSMPERGKLSNLVSFSENAGTNANFGTDSRTRSYPSDVPQTPSPPSSPDSVMIIGDEEQVSGSFLQGRRRSFITEDGWVTWANSPPRPIPALHGPLSLPYARCPSGAEGTVVEGGDLSHKIWGLGADDTPAHTRYQRALPHTAPQPAPVNRSPEIKAHILGDQYQASSHQRRRDTVIDLSRPSTFDHVQEVTQQHPRSSANTSTYGPSTTSKASTNLPDLAASAMAKLAILPHVYQPDYRDAPKKTYYAGATTGDQLGLALQWESLFNSDLKAKAWVNGPKTLGTSEGSSISLNTSAPPFVPQNYISASLIDRAILQDKPQNARTQPTQKPQTGQATHTLQDHNVQSPPSTVSPLWTPIFNQTADMHHAHGKSFGPKAGRQIPDVYSPELDRGGYQSDQLANMHTISQLQSYDLQNLSRGHTLNTEKYYSRALLGDSYSHQEPAHPHVGRPPIDIHQDLSPVFFDTGDYNHGTGNTTTTAAMDRRRSLTQQHPRSIPLARLIQRRLSSVVEEESLTGTYSDLNAPSSTSSFLRPTLPSGAPIRLLPVSSSNSMRAACSSSPSTVLAPRARPRMIDSTYTGDRDVQPVPPTLVSIPGARGGRRLQQLNTKEDQLTSKAVVMKPPGPRLDSAPRGLSNRSTRGRAATATIQKDHAQMKHSSREDASNVGEKENASTNANMESATAGRTPKKHHNKHKKPTERASAQASSKADRST